MSVTFPPAVEGSNVPKTLQKMPPAGFSFSDGKVMLDQRQPACFGPLQGHMRFEGRELGDFVFQGARKVKAAMDRVSKPNKSRCCSLQPAWASRQ